MEKRGLKRRIAALFMAVLMVIAAFPVMAAGETATNEPHPTLRAVYTEMYEFMYDNFGYVIADITTEASVIVFLDEAHADSETALVSGTSLVVTTDDITIFENCCDEVYGFAAEFTLEVEDYSNTFNVTFRKSADDNQQQQPAPTVPGVPMATPSAGDPVEALQSAVSPVVMSSITIAGTSADVRIVAGRATVQLDAAAVEALTEENSTVEFDFSGLNVISAGLPRHALRQFAAANMELEVLLPQGGFALDADALADLAATAHTSNVIFRITEVATEQMPESLVARLPEAAVINQVTIGAGSRTFRNLDGIVAVALPAGAGDDVFALGAGGRAHAVGAGVFVGTSSTLIPVEVEFVAGHAIFTANSLGLFIVG